MPTPLSASQTLEREFLGFRCRLIELAATLDRLDRAEGRVNDDPRMTQIRRALEVLAADVPDRTERVQMLFSLPYQERG